jgi:hypothetical protein
MSTKKELENILKAEIILAAKKLISAGDDDSFEKILDRFDKLHRKLSAYKYLKENGEPGWETFFPDRSMPAEKNGTQSPSGGNNTGTAEQNIVTPPQTSSGTPKEEPAGPVKIKMENPIKAHQDVYQKTVQTKFKPKHQSATDFTIGLADKIALVNNLFDNNSDAFDEFIQRINKTKSYDEALGLVFLMKDKYDWTGKDEYEFRLLQLIQAKFS